MPRVLQSLLALALFVAVGFGTRYYYRQWMLNLIHEAEVSTKKETSNWKAVEGNFPKVKIDKAMISVPKVDFPRQPAKRPNR